MDNWRYDRVLPRDLFNESKLLKCVEQLALKHHDGFAPRLKIIHDGSSFDIVQNQGDGTLLIENLHFVLRGESVYFYTVYNSQESYPLYVDWRFEQIAVFNNNGEFTKEFASLVWENPTEKFELEN